MKSYALPISKDYLSHWKAEDGIRELVQNALDSEGAFTWQWVHDPARDVWSLYLLSEGVQLHQSLLLLGSGSKGQNAEARGGFGEGFKLAFLVILREGLDIECYNKNKLWTPYFAPHEDFEAEMLHVGSSDLVIPNVGLEFRIHGLSTEQKEIIVKNTLVMQKEIEAKVGENGRILFNKELKGRIYVGGLFVCESDLDFGYDFNPDFMPLNRDRQSVSNWDLKREAQKLHMSKTEPEKVAEMLFSKVSDMEDMQYREYLAPETVQDACYTHFVNTYGEVPIATTLKEQNEMKAKGLKDTVFLGNEAFSNIAKRSVNYVEAETEELLSPAEEVAKFYDALKLNLTGESSVLYEELLEKAKNWGYV